MGLTALGLGGFRVWEDLGFRIFCSAVLQWEIRSVYIHIYTYGIYIYKLIHTSTQTCFCIYNYVYTHTYYMCIYVYYPRILFSSLCCRVSNF